MASLNSEIESKLIERGASLVGFADISSLPADIRNSMSFAVSIAVALDASIINQIGDGPTENYYQEYKRANELLTELGESTADDLRKNGSQAIAIRPTAEELNLETLATQLPHKMVATRAGLGWVGKSDLLITEQYGPAVRLVSVLTDAELEAAEPVNHSGCGDCEMCVVACPAKAIKGNHWQVGLEREVLVDAFACHITAKELSERIGSTAPICGICINVCPWTQKYISGAKGE